MCNVIFKRSLICKIYIATLLKKNSNSREAGLKFNEKWIIDKYGDVVQPLQFNKTGFIKLNTV